jgi:hypothetical protein
VSTERCKTPNCVRVLNHRGVCTAAPSGATLDWDHKQAERRYNDQTLMALDFPTPPTRRTDEDTA